MLFELPGPPKLYVYTDATLETRPGGDPMDVVFSLTVAVDPAHTWSAEITKMEISSKRPSEELLNTETWWLGVLQAVTHEVPDTSSASSRRITEAALDVSFSGRSEFQILGDPPALIKVTPSANIDRAGVSGLAEITLRLLSHADGDAKWVEMLRGSLAQHKRLEARNEETKRKLEESKILSSKAVKDLETMVKDKTVHEDRLYLRFKEVLNSKKRKISLLHQELELLRAEREDPDFFTRKSEEDEQEEEEESAPAPRKKKFTSSRRNFDDEEDTILRGVPKKSKFKMDKEEDSSMDVDEDEQGSDEEEHPRRGTSSRRSGSVSQSKGVRSSAKGSKASKGGSVASQSQSQSKRGTQSQSQKGSSKSRAKEVVVKEEEEDDSDEEMSPGIL